MGRHAMGRQKPVRIPWDNSVIVGKCLHLLGRAGASPPNFQ